MSNRTTQILKKNGIKSILELCVLTESDLLAMKGVGAGTVKEVRSILKNRTPYVVVVSAKLATLDERLKILEDQLYGEDA